MPKPDYYQILGVADDADAAAVRRAFRRLAKRWHPDRNREAPEAAEERFREIVAAWRVLGDAERRRRYDRETGRRPLPPVEDLPAADEPVVVPAWPAADAEEIEDEQVVTVGRLAGDWEATCGCLLLLVALSSPCWVYYFVAAVSKLYDVLRAMMSD